jgi:hypothetical protein
MVKGSAGILPHLTRFLKGGTGGVKHAVSVIRQSFGEASMRTAGTVAAYFALFKGLEELLGHACSGGVMNTFLAAMMSSVVLQGEPEADRWSWAQYFVARAVVATLKTALPRAHHAAVDHLLWAGSVGQLMYGFIMRPDVMEAGYEAYLRRVAVATPDTLRETRAVCQGGKVEADLCKCIHGDQTCLVRIGHVYQSVFKMSFPMYTGLYIVPSVILSQKYTSPIPRPSNCRLNLTGSLKTALRSSGFIAAVVATYQVLLCLQGQAHQRLRFAWIKHRYTYWLFGFLASSMVALESPVKRPELALFVTDYCFSSLIP